VHYRSIEDSDPEYELESDDSDSETCSEISLYDENDYEYE